MIEGGLCRSDTGSTVLPYYNSAVPSSPFSGPGNSGTPQNTLRKGIVNLQVKAGTAATTGTQVAPTVDSGFIALWLITVANGQVTISGGNIVQVANAPFLGASYMPKLGTIANYIQSGAWGICTDTGSANALAVAPSPPPVSIGLGTKLTVKIANNNTGATTMAVTLASGSVNTSPVVHGDLTALAGSDLLANQLMEFNYDGANWQTPRPPTSVTAQSLQASSVGMNAPINCTIAASVASNALTVTINGANGSALSATNPLVATFRDVTLANGDPVTRIVQSSPTFTVNSGNTLGVVNNAAGATNVNPRLWVLLIDNAGTVLVGLTNCLVASPVRVFPLDESSLQNTGTGTGGGSTAGTIYTSVASLTNKAVRIIGYLEWSTALGTSGTYNNAPNKVQLFGPGIKKPGDTVQVVYATNAAATTGSGTTPVASGAAVSITPTSASNVVHATANGTLFAASSNTVAESQIYRGTSNPIGNIAISFDSVVGRLLIGSNGSAGRAASCSVNDVHCIFLVR